eukprot:gene26072-11775_t
MRLKRRMGDTWMSHPMKPSLSYASAPRPTEAEGRASKRQLEALARDAKKVCATDLSMPFSSLQDALDRLIPFHVFADDSNEKDPADVRLICSRRQAWTDLMLRESVECTRKSEANRKQICELQRKYYGEDGGTEGRAAYPWEAHRLEEQVVLERLMVADARAALESEKRRPPGYITDEEGEDEANVEGSSIQPDLGDGADMAEADQNETGVEGISLPDATGDEEAPDELYGEEVYSDGVVDPEGVEGYAAVDGGEIGGEAEDEADEGEDEAGEEEYDEGEGEEGEGEEGEGEDSVGYEDDVDDDGLDFDDVDESVEGEGA